MTGGIASGKSTIADMFGVLGVPIIDTDAIAREIVEPGTAKLAEIRDHFGAEVVAADGSLDRRALRRIVFADTGERKWLEAALHPAIRAAALERADGSDASYVVIVVPLLYESPLRHEVDRILVVDCSEATQLRRLLARDGETEESARRIIASQASRPERLSIADDVIPNDADIETARKNVSELHRLYEDLAGESA